MKSRASMAAEVSFPGRRDVAAASRAPGIAGLGTVGVGCEVAHLLERVAPVAEVQRCDFARLLLSLEARRPVIVDWVREEGSRFLAEDLDSDPEIRDTMESEGLSELPSQWIERQAGPLEDNALARIQFLVDHREIGGRLINRHWTPHRFPDRYGGTFRSTSGARSWLRTSRCGLVPSPGSTDHILCRESGFTPPRRGSEETREEAERRQRGAGAKVRLLRGRRPRAVARQVPFQEVGSVARGSAWRPFSWKPNPDNHAVLSSPTFKRFSSESWELYAAARGGGPDEGRSESLVSCWVRPAPPTGGRETGSECDDADPVGRCSK